MSQVTQHVLPGEGKDDAWFKSQNAFEQSVIRQQVKFKRDRLGINTNGPHSKYPQHTYPHILPGGEIRKAFFPGFTDAVFAYFDEANIQPHSELLNLKSSQAACVNFLFPLRSDLELATNVLTRAGIIPPEGRVSGIEFEYTGQDEAGGSLGCTEWLGEPSTGKRGQNRTSIDAAVFWTREGRNDATLIEWKYTERTFGNCSAFANARSDAKAACRGPDHEKHCILTQSPPKCDRHYWDRLEESGIRRAKLACVPGCPFRGPFYQLMRQFLIAQYMRQSGQADDVEVLAIHFDGNNSLRELTPELENLAKSTATSIVDAWNVALEGVTPMREIKAEALLLAYDTCRTPDLSDWRDYIRARYGM